MTYKKPPLGITPKWFWDERRRDEIKEGIIRFMEANHTIPQNWVDEYNDLVKEKDVKHDS